MNLSNWPSYPRWYLAALSICAFITPGVALAQSAPSAATLAKYDKNKNGRLDPDEIAAMQADQDKYAKGLIPDPFQNVTILNGFPRTNNFHFFEKIDDLDTRPWRYGKIDNIEVLTRCSDEATKRFVSELQRRVQLMKSVLPVRTIASLDSPMRLFFYQQESWKGKMMENPNAIPTLGDRKETLTVVVNLWSYERSAGSMAADASLVFATSQVAHEFITVQLRSEMSPWLWSGLQHFILDLQFVSDAVNFAWPPFVNDPGLRGYREGWAPAKDELLAMDVLFNEPPAIRSNVYLDGVREVQLGLFVRWALLADHQQHKDAFWGFVTRAHSEAVTESLFKECFGIGYAEVRAELGTYLEKGRAAIPLHAIAGSTFIPIKPPEFNDATAAEIERFRDPVNFAYDESVPRL